MSPDRPQTIYGYVSEVAFYEHVVGVPRALIVRETQFLDSDPRVAVLSVSEDEVVVRMKKEDAVFLQRSAGEITGIPQTDRIAAACRAALLPNSSPDKERT